MAKANPRLPRPVNRDSSRADLWRELQSVRRELDGLGFTHRQRGVQLEALRRQLGDAYLRLRVIQAAVTHDPEQA